MSALYTWIAEVLGLVGDPNGKHYVYELRDKRFYPPKVFYVGEGQGTRMYDHEKEAHKLLSGGRGARMRMKPKHKRIAEIWQDGFVVDYQVVFRTNFEHEALLVEAYEIEHIVGLAYLTNETYGYSAESIVAMRRRKSGQGKRQQVPVTIYAEDPLEVLPAPSRGKRRRGGELLPPL